MTSPSNPSEKPTILVVDDSRTVRVSLSKMLREQFVIIEAVDGEDGWAKLLENSHIKLIISDILMPNLDGYGYICRIRGAENEWLQKIPIVVITSKEDVITRERAHACGANNFIVKPVDSADLLSVVKFHTEHSLTSDQKSAASVDVQYGSNVESMVLESPDLNKALEMLHNSDNDALDPYAIDLALKVLPLLEYCDKVFNMDVAIELNQLKSKLKSA